jgi:glycosyltransferase involved in cell wall biosynthesis
VKPNSTALLDLFSQADAFVFPTLGDCLPLAVMEALAAGLPVITTDVGALTEAVTHEDTGLIVPRDDPASLAQAITRLASDPVLCREMGQRARETACERFDQATNYRRLLTVIRGEC